MVNDVATIIGKERRRSSNIESNLGFIDTDPTVILEFNESAFLIRNTRIETYKTFPNPPAGYSDADLGVWDDSRTLWDSALWDVADVIPELYDVWNQDNIFIESFTNNRFKDISLTTANWCNHDNELRFV